MFQTDDAGGYLGEVEYEVFDRCAVATATTAEQLRCSQPVANHKWKSMIFVLPKPLCCTTTTTTTTTTKKKRLKSEANTICVYNFHHLNLG